MFLQAGFNARNHDTGIRGWTRHVRGNRGGFAPAELRRFVCGDYFWYGARFVVWGEQCVLGTHHGFSLPWEYQERLPQCDLDTREEAEVWPWVEERRRKMEAGEPLE